MRFSEAIRLGSMMKPQCVDGYANDDAACALLAGADALGLPRAVVFYGDRKGQEYVHYGLLREMFAFLNDPATHPVFGYEDDCIAVIYSLNDNCRWTRERIADWVETIENAQAVQVEPAVVAR